MYLVIQTIRLKVKFNAMQWEVKKKKTIIQLLFVFNQRKMYNPIFNQL